MNYICNHSETCENTNCMHHRIHDYSDDYCHPTFCPVIGKNVRCVTLPELVITTPDDVVVGM
jgi:hypothetical protein